MGKEKGKTKVQKQQLNIHAVILIGEGAEELYDVCKELSEKYCIYIFVFSSWCKGNIPRKSERSDDNGLAITKHKTFKL